MGSIELPIYSHDGTHLHWSFTYQRYCTPFLIKYLCIHSSMLLCSLLWYKQMNELAADTAPRQQQNKSHRDPIFYWIITLLCAFVLLPSFALDYGVFESTSQEFYDAMGWSGFNISWLWFALPTLLLIPLYWGELREG